MNWKQTIDPKQESKSMKFSPTLRQSLSRPEKAQSDLNPSKHRI